MFQVVYLPYFPFFYPFFILSIFISRCLSFCCVNPEWHLDYCCLLQYPVFGDGNNLQNSMVLPLNQCIWASCHMQAMLVMCQQYYFLICFSTETLLIIQHHYKWNCYIFTHCFSALLDRHKRNHPLWLVLTYNSRNCGPLLSPHRCRRPL